MLSLRTLPLLIAVAASALVGCKSHCRQLAEKLCDCSVSTVDREACLQDVQTREGNATVEATDDQKCADLLEQCDCHTVETAEGKIACGLAR